MCVIIYGKKKISDEILEESHNINPHGIGMMWAKDGVLKTWVTFNYMKFKQAYDALTNEGIFPAVHFRYATQGKIDIENCHPFRVNDNIGMMHNGTIHNGGVASTIKSDSNIFADSISDFTWEDVDMLNKNIFSSKINGSRLLFMNNNGDVKIINECSKLTVEHDNIWYSKNNVVKDIVLFVYGTLKRGHSNNSRIEDGTFVKEVEIENFDMYDLYSYPAIVDGTGTIKAEMFRITEDDFDSTDKLEGYPTHYDRKLVTTKCGETGWIYYYKNKPYSSKIVETGDWKPKNLKVKNATTIANFWEEDPRDLIPKYEYSSTYNSSYDNSYSKKTNSYKQAAPVSNYLKAKNFIDKNPDSKKMSDKEYFDAVSELKKRLDLYEKHYKKVEDAMYDDTLCDHMSNDEFAAEHSKRVLDAIDKELGIEEDDTFDEPHGESELFSGSLPY